MWLDLNGDAVQDPGELGIENVTLELWTDPNGDGDATLDGNIYGTQTTGINGIYLFTGLPPGSYVVFVTDTNGELTGLGFTTNNEPYPVTVVGGQTYLDADFGYEPGPVSITKQLLPIDEMVNTVPNQVAIGEIIEYEVSVTFGPGASHTSATLTDILDRGLAFMDCDAADISVDAGLTTTLAGGFTDLCSPQAPPNNLLGNPAISEFPGGSLDLEDEGRQLLWSLGDVENTAGVDQTLTFIYRVIVLDIADNVRGGVLNNDIFWGNGLGRTSAVNVEMVEPTVDIEKTVNSPIASPGDILTFRLEIFHTGASDSDAFETIINDEVEAEFTYVPGSLRYVSGQAPTLLDETNAPNLQITWATFLNNGVSGVVEFDVIMGVIPPGSSASNTGYVEWSSFPGDRTTPQSPWNVYSTERWYDPPDPVDIYGGVSSSAVVTFTTGLASEAGFALPQTGFAPEAFTPLPAQPETLEYADLGDIWLEIPSQGVRMPIVGVPFTEEGWVVDFLNGQAGYLEGTSYPTLPGNTAITGHVWNADGTPGLFYRLDELRFGEQVIIHAYGQQYVYEIRSNNYVQPGNLSVLGPEEYDWVTLITCESYNEETGEYELRTVARAVLVKVISETGAVNTSPLALP